MTISTHPLHDLTFAEISSLIHACPFTHVGLRDVFTDEEILDGLGEHPCWHEFPKHFQSWAFNAMGCIFDEELERLKSLDCDVGIIVDKKLDLFTKS